MTSVVWFDSRVVWQPSVFGDAETGQVQRDHVAVLRQRVEIRPPVLFGVSVALWSRIGGAIVNQRRSIQGLFRLAGPLSGVESARAAPVQNQVGCVVARARPLRCRRAIFAGNRSLPSDCAGNKSPSRKPALGSGFDNAPRSPRD